MPFKQSNKVFDDGVSLFFYWDKSYILGNKDLYYDFYISHDTHFDNSTTPYAYYSSTSNNYIAVPTSSLQSNTMYFFRVIARNSENPTLYFQYSYQAISSSNGPFGVSNFTTPALAATPTSQTASISNSFTYTDSKGAAWKYATLDNLDPSTATSACQNVSYAIPDGWVIAPSNNLVRSHIAAMRKGWGGSNLVCRDGTALNRTTGDRLDGFGTYNMHLWATGATDGTQMYYAQCTDKYNGRVLLADPKTLDSVDDDPEPTLPSTSSASVLTSSVVLIAYVIATIMF